MVPFFSGIPHFLQLMMIELGMAVAPIILIATPNIGDEGDIEYVENYIRVNKYFFVDNNDQKEFVNNIVNDIFGFGILQQFLADPEVQEIFVEGSKGIFYEKNGERINGGNHMFISRVNMDERNG